jgi:uncharacterized repeat protein (TIGR03837 family)
MPYPRSVDLFCRVVDNYGDIGVCWRLARQLAGEHGLAVRLWVDHLASFRRLCCAIDPDAEEQRHQGVTVRRWHEGMALPAPEQVADVVVEAFGCALPEAFLAAMAARSVAPAWINLEYLSAEDWVEGCHRLPSPHPSLPLIKYFFFPGFTGHTGGLLREADLDARRAAFQSGHDRAAFLAGIGVHPAPGALLVSLFCYGQAPVASLLESLENDAHPGLLLVPQGVAPDALQAWCGSPLTAMAPVTRGSLTVQAIPFLDQPDYDRLLWSCDLNFVRGEDSMVRAQWARQPFVWHIYPQQEQAHRLKLDAFLARYCAGMPPAVETAVRAAWHAWNEGGDWGGAWPAFRAALPALRQHMEHWSALLASHGDLAGKLVQFIRDRHRKQITVQSEIG